MIRKIVGTLVVAALVTVSVQEAQAQISLGYTDIGAVIGLGNIGSASASFGGRFERIFKELPDLGDGLLGIGISADYYSWNTGVANYSWKYIPIGATANYHFKLENKKIDPFVGLGLGYNYISCSYSGPGGSGFSNLCSNSAIYFIGRAGARYFLNPNMALYGDVGAGAATVNLGLTFKLK